VVAVTIFEKDVADFETLCKAYELGTHKRQKWNKTRRATRLQFARLVLGDARFAGKLFYTWRRQSAQPDYDHETVAGIKDVFATWFTRREYTAEIYIDGISKAKRQDYQTELRRLDVQVHKVHLARDESYPLIRLADTIAGLVRAALEGDAEAEKIVRQAKKLDTLREA
jgi:hypothetical protein